MEDSLHSSHGLVCQAKEIEKGDAQVMRGTVEHDSTEHPLMRVITLGEFALERLVPTPSRTPDEPSRYTRVARSEWSNRGPAMALLKVLLCQANRRASRDELIEAIWPDHEAINAAHALDSAASVQQASHLARAQDVPPEHGCRRVECVRGIDRLVVGPDGLDEFISRCPAVRLAQEHLQQGHCRSAIAPLAPCYARVTRRLIRGPRGSGNEPFEGEFPERDDPHQRMLLGIVLNCTAHRLCISFLDFLGISQRVRGCYGGYPPAVHRL